MGCGSSKVAAVAHTPRDGEKEKKVKRSTANIRQVPSANSSMCRVKSTESMATRQTSASSRLSKDSGVDVPPEIGKIQRKPTSGKQRGDLNMSRLEQNEDDIIKQLATQGLIAAAPKTVAGGMSFEILNEPAVTRKPPTRLQKIDTLEFDNGARTKDEIMEKLRRAERRRKKRETQLKEKQRRLRLESETVHHNIRIAREATLLAERNDKGDASGQDELNVTKKDDVDDGIKTITDFYSTPRADKTSTERLFDPSPNKPIVPADDDFF